ncbi:13315_t:CDS:2 [Funneliformis mosseae]|uniref:13315_t:CDS:1 n=1 Tax=Funneliformis mosseae TaxID=27381 RepID=A0A9N8ZQ29_FUNMO|nr:13315_t:CDS:2 [Funneliformis mosseae]
MLKLEPDRKSLGRNKVNVLSSKLEVNPNHQEHERHLSTTLKITVPLGPVIITLLPHIGFSLGFGVLPTEQHYRYGLDEN